MKVKDGFVLRQIGGRHMAVPVGSRTKEVHGMIALNGTGAFLWEQLSSPKTEEDLVLALLSEYDVDRERAERAVKSFAGMLAENGVLADG